VPLIFGGQRQPDLESRTVGVQDDPLVSSRDALASPEAKRSFIVAPEDRQVTIGMAGHPDQVGDGKQRPAGGEGLTGAGPQLLNCGDGGDDRDRPPADPANRRASRFNALRGDKVPEDPKDLGRRAFRPFVTSSELLEKPAIVAANRTARDRTIRAEGRSYEMDRRARNRTRFDGHE
jgi:hypothetical protein